MPVNPALIKQANDVAAHRELSPDEEQQLEAGKSRWLPRIFQSYGTPIPDLMASPHKTGLIFGLPAGALGAALGAGIGGAMSGKDYSGLGALIGGLGAGGAAYWGASSDREARNEGLEEIMRRMPEGAAKRDLLADPQYQSDFLGWDNNKIVATARARYYRPTERFTKRTSDMRDARERYNDRQKESSSTVNVFMGQQYKQNSPSIHAESDDMSDKNKQAAQALLTNTTLSLAEKAAAYQQLRAKQAALPTDVPAGSYADRPTISFPDTADDLMLSPPLARVSPTVGEPDGRVPPLPPKVLPNVTTPPKAFNSRRDYNSASNAVLKMVAARQAAEERKKLQPLMDHMKSLTRKRQPNEVELGDYTGLGNLQKGLSGAMSGIRRGAGNVYDAMKGLGSYLKPEPTKVPDPTMWDKIKPYAPYAAVGGAGLGALALADYLSRRSKKKSKKDNYSEEEDDRPARKAASLNWYALKQQKLAMSPAIAKPIINYLPNLVARLSSAGDKARTTLSALPQWAKITGGVAGAGGAGAGIGALGGMFTRDEPSMLQQIMNYKYTPHIAAGVGTAGLLGGAAYMGNRAGKNEGKKKKKPEGEKQSNLGGAGMGAAGGATLGGAGGLLYGALAPGYERDPDTGRRKRRSRLTAALRGLAGGAAVGGGIGGAAGYMAGDKNINALLEKFLASKGQDGAALPTESGIKTEATMSADPLNAAKADANTPVASGSIPQGPTNANATQGVPNQAPNPMDAMTGSAPAGNIPGVQLPGSANPVPGPAPVIPQGPAGMSATTGVPNMYPQGMM